MSHSNSTANYNLPQFVGGDKPTFLGDINSAYTQIDAQMKVNADGVASATGLANTAQETASEAQASAEQATQSALQATAVANSKISASAGAVGENFIADGAVTEQKIGANAVSEEKIADGAVTYDKVAVTGFPQFNYQTGVEQAIGVWIDGKTIYRQVIQGTTANAVKTSQVITQPIAGLKEVVSLRGIATHVGSDKSYLAVNYADNPYGSTYELLSCSYNDTLGLFERHNYTYMNNQPITMIIEYTK